MNLLPRFAYRTALLPALALLFIAAGLLALLPAIPLTPRTLWLVGLVITGTPVVGRALAGVLRGHFAADLVATLAILTSAVLLEPLPGLIVVLMQTGGEALERYAEGRASQAVRELEAAAPRFAHRLVGDRIEEIAATDLRVGDLVLIRPGELVPCDGVVESGQSHVDQSTLTGEPVPIAADSGTSLMSGSINGEGALVLKATRTSAESRYARIVELVRSAQESKSPIQRVADRYAVWFTPLTLAVCAVAYALSGDPMRILSVLVIATPCPLILATPVAIVGGINRAARRQIIVRDGGAMERLAGVDTAAFDKTGTLTFGTPHVSGIAPLGAFERSELLRLAASLEQASGHLLGRAVVTAARDERLPLSTPTAVRERPGRGISGSVENHDVLIGTRGLLLEVHPGLTAEVEHAARDVGGLHAWIVVDGRLAGTLHFADRMRPAMPQFIAELRELGIRRTLLVSGDHAANVAQISAEAGITESFAELLPEDKVRIVRRLQDDHHRVVMIGDGVNDAPALSSATVGIALAGHGGGITAEAADIVLLIDEPSRVADALRISRRTLRIAKQSIGVGLGLSGVGMLFAAAGYIPPTVGALVQEAIDIAVIFNALRAAAPGTTTAPDASHSPAPDAAPLSVGAPG